MDKFVSDVSKVLTRVRQEENRNAEKTAFEFWVYFYDRIISEQSLLTPACSLCSAKDGKNVDLLQKCGGCELLWYCSVSCQKR